MVWPDAPEESLLIAILSAAIHDYEHVGLNVSVVHVMEGEGEWEGEWECHREANASVARHITDGCNVAGDDWRLCGKVTVAIERLVGLCRTRHLFLFANCNIC